MRDFFTNKAREFIRGLKINKNNNGFNRLPALNLQKYIGKPLKRLKKNFFMPMNKFMGFIPNFLIK